MKRVCTVCAGPVTASSKTGLCRPCSARRLTKDPALNETRLAGMREKFKTPEARAARSERARKRYSDPAQRKATGEALSRSLAANPHKHREAARRNIQIAVEINKGKDWSAIHRARAAERRAWCPADRWDEYRRLVSKMPAEEAKRIMLDDLAAAERRRVAALSPFDRQMEAVRNGAKLIDKPVFRQADHAFSLTGGSLA